MAWLEITINTAPGGCAAASEALTAAGFSDLVIEDQTEFETFLEENRACWDYIDEDLQQSLEGLSRIKLYLEDTDRAGRARLEQVLDRLGLTMTAEPLPDTDWSESWKENYPPQEVGEKLLILPFWLADTVTDRHKIILDPGLTFGTGAHPSTQMVLQAMEDLVRPGFHCLDLGSGSGILSIAALRLGAETAVGVDIDPKAADISRENAAYNGLSAPAFTARTGLNNPHAPTAIFLLVGPSGVGTTETALAIADELYGGEDMLISINMSEFQEKHTISRLIGSPPGYVGYGEGGRLTEAVRRQPYSVVLFDEVEKAHPDVLNLFYQMFDKGVLVDGEGRETDFRNTMIFLTSNLGSDIVAALCEDETPPDPATLVEALRPALTQFFRPALLGRMTIVPYMSLRPDIMRELVDMKISRIAARLFAQHRLPLVWSDEVAASIAASCTVTDAGARNIDHIINASLLPRIASALLAGRGHGGRARICVELGQERGSFVCSMTEDGGRG